jgi:hypothetical protein
MDKAFGVVGDQTAELNGLVGAADYPEHLRRVRYNGPAIGKAMVFLPDNQRQLTRLRAHRHCQERAPPEFLVLHLPTDFVGLGFRDNPDFMRLVGR